MAAPGGPDEETWQRMSPGARKIYWVVMALVFGIIGTAFLIKLLK